MRKVNGYLIFVIVLISLYGSYIGIKSLTRNKAVVKTDSITADKTGLLKAERIS